MGAEHGAKGSRTAGNLLTHAELAAQLRVITGMAHLDRLASALGFVAIAFAAGCGSVTTAGTNPSTRDGLAPPPTATRVAVLELGQFDGERNSCIFGFDVDADTLATARRTLEEERVELVIIRVNASHSDLSECIRVANELEAFDAQFRTVLLIDSAILNGALAVWSVDEIYMRPQANFGAASVWHGRAIRRGYFDDLLVATGVVSALGKRDSRLLRSMLFTGVPLSATRIGSKVELFGDESSGEFLINREYQMLNLNAISAYNAGVSQGTSHDVPSLLVQLGIENAEFVGGGANEELQRVSRDRIEAVERIDDLTRQSLMAVSALEQMADGPSVDSDVYWPIYARARFVVERLRVLANEQRAVASHSMLANVNDSPSDETKESTTIAAIVRRLEAAHKKATTLIGRTAKE